MNCRECKDQEGVYAHPSGVGSYCGDCLDAMIEEELNPTTYGYYYPGTMDRW